MYHMQIWYTESQKSALDPLELKLQVLMSCFGGARTKLGFPAKEQAPLTSESTL